MKRLVVMTGAALAVLSAVSAAGADPRDSVDRGDRLDRDAIRDDVRIDRLKVPEHPLYSQQPALPHRNDAAANEGRTNKGQRMHQRRRPQTRAMPASASNRQIQLRRQQEQSR